MLKSFFSFVQCKTLSLYSSQRALFDKMMLCIFKQKEQHAALFLYVRTLEPYFSRKTAMSAQKFQNYKQHPSLFSRGYTKAAVVSRNRSSLMKNKPLHTNSRTRTVANRTTKHPSKTQKQILLTWIQPGLAGLMDGSVSTLAPIFAAAFATGDTYKTFLIGLSASIGAGLSMGFTEAAHDDGKLSGRGSPLKRGIASGIMTTVGGLGHTLPYLIHSFYIATIIAFIVVFFELGAIVWIQNKYMSTPFWRASLQVIIGGTLVFVTGILIGSI
ncbi:MULTISPECIES: hypothetical protein [unclassified Bartonella]|uniref:hypothetical protein n=1 Tax=unclassified Bartonella TaxID=2645622 RepID=UPI00300DE881